MHDLIFLLKQAGFPSQNQFFVFNGNYVNHGAWGLETFLLLLAWKVFHFSLINQNSNFTLLQFQQVLNFFFNFNHNLLVSYFVFVRDVWF